MKNKLLSWTKSLINKTFKIVKTRGIPTLGNSTLTFANKGMQFEATTLFIDMRNSTKLLKKHNKTTIAKIYSIFFINIVLIAKKMMEKLEVLMEMEYLSFLKQQDLIVIIKRLRLQEKLSMYLQLMNQILKKN